MASEPRLVKKDAPEWPQLWWVDPSSIDPNISNWRIHTEDQTALVRDHITDPEIGWADVTLYNLETNEFINGHLRREIAIAQGIDRIPVLVGRWPKDKQHAIHAALDLSTGMAKTDVAKLAALIRTSRPPTSQAADIVRQVAARLGVVPDPEGDAPGPGGDGGGSGDANDGSRDEAEIEKLRIKWGVEPGQLWWARSGDGSRAHRMIVGSCTDKHNVDALMKETRADMVFTSPPYGNQREYQNEVNWDELMKSLAWALPVHDDAQLFFNLGVYHEDGEWVEYWHPFLDELRKQGWRKFQWIVWDQTQGIPGDWFGRFAQSYEFVFHLNKNVKKPHKIVPCKRAGEIMTPRPSGKKIGVRNSSGGRSGSYDPSQPMVIGDTKILDNVVRVLRATSQGIAHLHPAIFSIEFAQKFVESYSDSGNIIYEPFLGSMTTILACDAADRTCHGCEISPGYFAVGLERLELAGLSPRRCD